MDPSRLVFIDESSAKTNMTRLRGRCLRGERLLSSSPHGHWHTTTMISAIRWDGSTASMTIEGATDTAVFGTYLQEVLCPSLKTGDLVIMDNLSAHKQDEIVCLIEATGATACFLPPYSPDLNPIEKMWSKVKNSLRSQAARTYEELLQAIALALKQVSPQDARNWFASCGYNFI